MGWTDYVILCVVFLATTLTTATRIGDGWGTNIHWTSEPQPGETQMLSKAFKLARVDFSWTTIESKCGTYDFSAYDSLLATMTKYGVRPYWIIGYSNPTCYPPPPNTPPNSCTTQACITAYGKLAQAAASHFKGKGILFESINEPNGMGTDNATVLSALVKEGWNAFGPLGESWVAPAVSQMDFRYLNATFANGLLSTVTGVSVHPYRGTFPETVLTDYVTLRQMITSYLPGSTPDTMPILCGEWGYTTAYPCIYRDKTDELGQAWYLARMWLSNVMAGVTISIAYDWHDDGTDHTACEENFGSVRYNATGNSSQPYLPKPSYLAAVAIQQTIGNAVKYVNRVSPTNNTDTNIFIAKFVGSSGLSMFAAWYSTTRKTSVNIQISFPSGVTGQSCWNVMDTLGVAKPKLCSSSNGLITLNVTGGPLYLY